MASVLIIDDDKVASNALAKLLASEGHEATCAASAGEALSQLRHSEPDLVLLDLTLPHVDGLDLLDALADEPRFADLKVVVHSGRTEPEALATAERLGACDFIPKGQDWDHLYSRIKAQLPADPRPA